MYRILNPKTNALNRMSKLQYDIVYNISGGGNDHSASYETILKIMQKPPLKGGVT